MTRRAFMGHERPPIDWDGFDEASRDGRFMDLLVKLPRERWAERDENGRTLLHYACRGPNVAAVVALVQSGLVDVNVRTKWELMPALFAAVKVQPRVMEVLCAAGADLRAHNDNGDAPIDSALMNAHEDDGKSVRVLMANGVRLSTVNEYRRDLITPALEAFERGVLCCRAAVVAMLCVKRASGQLWMWDKFLLLEIALCIWSTRYAEEWPIAAQQQLTQ